MRLFKHIKDKKNSYLKKDYSKNPSGITLIELSDYDWKFCSRIFNAVTNIDNEEQSTTTDNIYIDTRNGNLILKSLISRNPCYFSSSSTYEITYEFFYDYIKRISSKLNEPSKKKHNKTSKLKLNNDIYYKLQRDNYKEWLSENKTSK